MNTKQYIVRNSKTDDLNKIKGLFNSIFTEEEGVGNLALEASRSMPKLSDKNWYLIEDNEGELLAGLVRVNWDITYSGIELKVWEQAIVGTKVKHRGRGLLRELNSKLDLDAENNSVDMLMIQGIPGFYQKFSYRYAIEFENHINLKLDRIKGNYNTKLFREATTKDFPVLIGEEKIREKIFTMQSHRTEDDWDYIFNSSKSTEYASDLWIIDNRYFVKIQKQGFGDGLIISEISEELPEELVDELLMFLKVIATKREKPYLRFDISNSSPVSKKLQKRGAILESFYGWQVKIINRVNFLNKIKTVIEERIKSSAFRSYTGTLALNTNGKKLILDFKNGECNAYYDEIECSLEVTLPEDLFEPLVLGYRSYSELNYCRPDLFKYSDKAQSLVEVIFPKSDSWLYSIW